MSLTLEQFAAECRRALQANSGVEGRKQVCALVEEACKDQAFVAAHYTSSTGQRDILYEDPGSASASARITTPMRARASRMIMGPPGRSTVRSRARR